MTNVTRASRGEAGGTSLQGYIDVSYAELVKRLGPPDEADDHKVDAEWVLRFEDGTVATVYNYKTGHNYLGDEGSATEAIRDWHIGGRDGRVVELVHALFAEQEGGRTMTERELYQYYEGVKEGIRRYAVYQNGEQLVGVLHRPLRQVLAEVGREYREELDLLRLREE